MAREAVKQYRLGPMFLPPVVSKVGGPLAAITLGTLGGGTNWPGAGSIRRPTPSTTGRERRRVTARSGGAAARLLGCAVSARSRRQEFRINEGPGFGSAADAPVSALDRPSSNQLLAAGDAPPPRRKAEAEGLSVQGLSIVKPPYGVLSAINVDKGELLFKVPHGDTPDVVRNHPLLQGSQHSEDRPAGRRRSADHEDAGDRRRSDVTTTPEPPRGAMLRAYNKQTGEEVGASGCRRAQSGSPMTYSVDGKQYIIVAVSGGNYSGEYLAFSLPNQ